MKSNYHFECALSLLSLPPLSPLPLPSLSPLNPSAAKEDNNTQREMDNHGEERERESTQDQRGGESEDLGVNDWKMMEIIARLKSLRRKWKSAWRRRERREKERGRERERGEREREKEKEKEKEKGRVGATDEERRESKHDERKEKPKRRRRERMHREREGEEERERVEKERGREENEREGGESVLPDSTVTLLHNCATSHLTLAWDIHRERERRERERREREGEGERKRESAERGEGVSSEVREGESELCVNGEVSLTQYVETHLMLAIHRYSLLSLSLRLAHSFILSLSPFLSLPFPQHIYLVSLINIASAVAFSHKFLRLDFC
jgi:hypothetical protein